MSSYLSIITANINNSSSAKSSIGLKISGKGLNDNSNNSYDNNGIGFELLSNTSNYKELAIINTSNLSGLSIITNDKSIMLKTSNKPLIINSNLFINNSNIGIGITNPQSSLHIKGNITLNGTININNSQWSNANNNIYYNQSYVGIGITNPQSLIHLSASQQSFIKIDNFTIGKDSNQNGLLWNYDNYSSNLIFGTSNQEKLRITSNGSIGIGTTNPLTTIDIRGNLILNGTINNNALNNINLWSNINNKLYYSQGYVGIGITNPQSLVHLSASQSFVKADNFTIGKDSNQNGLLWNYDNYSNLIFGTSNQERLRITSNGRIGIGTTNPLTTIDIRSNVNINGNLIINNTIINPTIINSNVFYYSNQELNISNFNLSNYKLPITTCNVNNISATNDSYLLITSNTTIQINNPIYSDLLLVGGGGNGGLGAYSGGSGAGEVIYYTNYPFLTGTYNFNVGISTNNPINRISKITFNSSDVIKALGGGDGGGYQLINTNNTITLTQNSIIRYNFGSDITINSGTYTITFATGAISVTTFANNNSYPIITDTGGNIINPNLWCKFDTGSIITNYGTDSITLTNNSVTNANVSVKGNNSASFNGSSGYLNGTIEGIANNSFSVSMWIYPLTTSATKGVCLGLGSVGGSSTYTSIFMGIGIHEPNKYWFGFLSDDDSKSVNTYASDANTWVYLTFTYNSSTKVKKIYRNGVSIEITNSTSAQQPNPDNVIVIGNFSRPGTYYYYGYMDDLRIYKGLTLTEAQINELYKGRVEILQNPTSGGSGGGSYLTNSGGLAGTPNNENYSLITSGKSGSGSQGGSGGSALSAGGFSTTITDSSLTVGTGGSGATSLSTPATKTNYGDGGDGNGGLGAQGVIIMRFPTTANKYLTITNNFSEMSNIQVSGNIYTSNSSNNFTLLDNYWTKSNIIIVPNLWYKFDTETITLNSGSDTISLTNNGVTNADISIKGNNSARFNGTSQYLSGTINSISGNSWSIAVWIYPKANTSGIGTILSFGSVDTSYNCISIGYGITTAGCYTHYDFNSEATSSDYTNDINTWIHLVFMYDAVTRTRYIYRNGVKLILTGNITANGQTNVNTNLSIGKIGVSGGYYYNGYIDDLRVYIGKVLTQQEINLIYNDTNTYNIYYSQGNVGIGTVRTQYKLDVIGDVNITGSYYQNNTILSYTGSGTYIFSDSRIKTNIIDINDNSALQQILKIEPKIYNYIDKAERGTDTVYGFIAQQIREVIPEAVKIQTDFIPNIYKWFDYDYYKNQIITNEDLTAILRIGDRIKIRDNNQDYYRSAIIINITTAIIAIDLNIYGDRCFIYGKEINDFHYLDKSYIYTLGVCATQDLYKMLQGLNDRYEQQQLKIRRIKELLLIGQ